VKILIICFILFISLPGFAWLHVEPYIGYNRGQVQATRTQGIGFGARLGLEFKSIFVAADVAMHDVQQGSLATVKHTDTGVTVGGLIKNYRIWYGLLSPSSYTYKSGTNDVKYKGAGSKFGLGVELSSNFFMNMEFRIIDYSETETAGTVTPISEIGSIGYLSLSWVL
jgi:hypothetical protein